jgi:hypothetical protein
MLRFLFALTFLFSSAVASIGRADVIFSIAKTTPGDVLLGSTATFDVFARTDTGTQAFQVLTFDFVLDNTTGAGGELTNPTQNALGGGWAIIDPYTALYDGLSTGSFNSLTTTNAFVGQITVTAANPAALAGTYTMRLANVSVTPLSGSVNASAAAPLSYTISAVPEPGSMALVCVMGLGAAWRYRRRASAT